MPIALGKGAFRCRAQDTDDFQSSVTEDWSIYKASGSVASRNRLVSHYMATHVRPIAVRIHATLPSQVDVDDLVQQGYLGLIDAMDRFDINRDIRFETFSRSRIFGAVHDYLRSIDPVPRLTRTRSKQLQAIMESHLKRHGSTPSDDELGGMLNLPEPALRRVLTDRKPAAMVPFSNVHPEGEAGDDLDVDAMDAFEDHSEPGPLRIAQRQDLIRWLTHGFDRRDRLIIILYYYEQLAMREVARALGISESRVSQRLESILCCLRSRLHATGAEQEFIIA